MSDIRRVRDLNDEFRATREPDTVYWSPKLEKASFTYRQKIIVAIAHPGIWEQPDLSDHDTGKVKISGRWVAWKIFYRTPDLQGDSPDPGNPDVTQRMMIVWFRSELPKGATP